MAGLGRAAGLVAILVAVGGTLPALAGAASHDYPKIVLDPERGPIGTVTKVQGSNFQSRLTYHVTWDRVVRETFDIGDARAFERSLAVPSGQTLRAHLVTVCNDDPSPALSRCQSEENPEIYVEDSTFFFVEKFPFNTTFVVKPPRALPREVVEVNAAGLRHHNAPATVFVTGERDAGDANKGMGTVEASGGFSFQFTVDATMLRGSYAVEVCAPNPCSDPATEWVGALLEVVLTKRTPALGVGAVLAVAGVWILAALFRERPR